MALELRRAAKAEVEIDPNEVPRDRWGRPKLLVPDGSHRAAYARASSVGAVLENKEGLMMWKARLAAWGAVHFPRLADELQDIEDLDDPDSKKILNRVTTALQEAAGASRKAERGTNFHTLTEQIDKGGDLGYVPSYLRDMASAYEKLTTRLAQERGYEVVLSEEFCVNDYWSVAGTPDRIVMIDGAPAVLDVKTMGSMDFGIGKIIMQMYNYGQSLRYSEVDAKAGHDVGYGVGRTLMVPGFQKVIDRGFILWVPQGQDKAVLSQEYDLRHGEQGMELARDVREWDNMWKRKAYKFRSEAEERS